MIKSLWNKLKIIITKLLHDSNVNIFIPTSLWARKKEQLILIEHKTVQYCKYFLSVPNCIHKDCTLLFKTSIQFLQWTVCAKLYDSSLKCKLKPRLINLHCVFQPPANWCTERTQRSWFSLTARGTDKAFPFLSFTHSSSTAVLFQPSQMSRQTHLIFSSHAAQSSYSQLTQQRAINEKLISLIHCKGLLFF